MEKARNLKSAAFDSLKEDLRNIKQMIEETSKTSEKVENESKDIKLQHLKTLNTLHNIQSTQTLKVSKLESEIKSLEAMITSRTAEANNLENINEQIKSELLKLKNDEEKIIEKGQKACTELEANIKLSFYKLQNDKDLITLWEMGLNLTSPEEKQVFRDMFCRKKAAADKKHEILKRDLAVLEAASKNQRDDIAAKREQLEILQEKYLKLKRDFTKAKEAKEAREIKAAKEAKEAREAKETKEAEENVGMRKDVIN